MPVTTFKTYNVTPGQFIAKSFGEYFIQGANPDPPSWFDWQTDDPFGFEVLIGYNFTAPADLGTYEIFFVNLLTEGIYKIVIDVTVDAYDAYANCCETPQNPHRNIAWLGIHGGWQNYIFTGIKTFQIDAGRDKQFKTNGYVLKHSEVNGVYDGEIITTGDIPKSHVDILDGLRAKSIQAFLYNSDTNAWDIPILVDRSSYSKYKTRDKFFEVRMKFIYAEEILVQSQ